MSCARRWRVCSSVLMSWADSVAIFLTFLFLRLVFTFLRLLLRSPKMWKVEDVWSIVSPPPFPFFLGLCF